jgi:hypothetical protein
MDGSFRLREVLGMNRACLFRHPKIEEVGIMPSLKKLEGTLASWLRISSLLKQFVPSAKNQVLVS